MVDQAGRVRLETQIDITVDVFKLKKKVQMQPLVKIYF